MFQQAINDINKAIELDPQNVNYWVEKGGVCLRVNQTAEAVQALEKAISIDSQNAPAYRMLGYIQVQQKQTEKGIAIQGLLPTGDVTKGNSSMNFTGYRKSHSKSVFGNTMALPLFIKRNNNQ